MRKISSFFSPKGRGKRFPSDTAPNSASASSPMPPNSQSSTTPSIGQSVDKTVKASINENKRRGLRKLSSMMSPESVKQTSTKHAPLKSPGPSSMKPSVTLNGTKRALESSPLPEPKRPNVSSQSLLDSSACLDKLSFQAAPSSPAPPSLREKPRRKLPSREPAAAAAAGAHSSAPAWLRNPRDANLRLPSDPAYDPRTIHVPDSALSKMTPAQQQFWKIKSENYDVVLFFKQGKFYELFDMDAEIGHRELNLIVMKGERCHVGFPEKSFAKYAEMLVHLGYKVGRVEQTETPAEMKERNKKLTRKSKVVNRELVSLLTKGTLVDGAIIGHDHSSFLFSLCEDPSGEQYGITIVDTSTGEFKLGQFSDDGQRTRLRTLLAQLRPEEIVHPRHGLTRTTMSVLAKDLRASTLVNALEADTEFWDAAITWDELGSYFPAERPACLEEMRASSPLALSALGGIIFYLRRVLLDSELISVARFSRFDPADAGAQTLLALDGQTLANLEILENSDGGTHGSLLHYLDHCVTPFGRRLLRDWITRPLLRIDDINARLDAVEVFINDAEFAGRVRDSLKKLPDLARLLSRIHAHGVGRDSKAVMYENVTAKKLNMFLDVIEGLRASLGLVDSFAELGAQLTSERLRWLSTIGEGFPDLRELLDFFDKAFDKRAARKDGVAMPGKGVDADFDRAEERIGECVQELESVLKETQRELGDRKICFTHKNKERYQLEVSDETLSRVGGAPEHLELLSQRKGFQRYWTPRLRQLVEQLDQAEEERAGVLQNIIRSVFKNFAQHYLLWSRAVDALSEIDCLISFSLTSSWSDGVMCRPRFVPPQEGEQALLELREARHPALVKAGASFIPNDTVIGTAENVAPFTLVTGPNMGGKSTLLRQTCVAVIIAQLGCYVPASKCRLTPVDRIFTRVGACDRILSGQSTFFVELDETSTILRHASKQSLVILDELGRGTSTFDGTALAWAVADHLSHEIACRTLFSTHYHLLSVDFANDAAVSNYHMSFRLEEESNTLTFLYKFKPGVCPKSFGMNVATMAGLSAAVVRRAEDMSSAFEEKMRLAHAQTSSSVATPVDVRERLRVCVRDGDVDGMRRLHEQLLSSMDCRS